MRKFLVVSFINPEFPREFPVSDWPPHVTVTQSFETALAETAIAERLESVCRQNPPIQVAGKSREMFGPDLDVPVTEVTCPRALQELRDDIRQAYAGDVSYPSLPYPSYRPHVTDQRGAQFPVGAEVTLGSASLVEKIEGRCVVWGTFELGVR